MYPQYPNQNPFSYQSYYPMNSMMPNMMNKPSLLQSMKYSIGQLSMSSTLRTAQKTLYTANQLIPIINQLRPVLHNATTAFRVVKAVKSFDFDDIDQEIDKNIIEKKEPEVKTDSKNNDNIFENML